MRESLRRVLLSEHYEVALASSGEEALEEFYRARPDLVLLDLNIPYKNGWEVLQRLHATRPALPIIIITARPHQQAQAVTAGASTLMEKPLDLPVLLETIATLTDRVPPRGKAVGSPAASIAS